MKTPDASLDRLERSLGRLLQAGVFSSAACLAVGLIAWMIGGASAPATLALTLPYDPKFVAADGDYRGASLKAMCQLARDKSYRLVGTHPGEPHLLQHRPERLQGNPGVLADLPVGPPRAERPAPERRALQERERQPAGCSAAPGAASTGTADPTVALTASTRSPLAIPITSVPPSQSRTTSMRPTGPAAPHTRAVLPASGHTRVGRCAVTPALGRRGRPRR